MASPSHSLGSRPNHVWGVSVSYGSTQGWNVVFPSLPRASVRRLQHLSHAGSVLRGSRCLLAAVAAWDARPQQEAHVDSACSRDTPQPTTPPSAARVGVL